MLKALTISAGLVLLMAQGALAGDRYGDVPPIADNQDPDSPWITQLSPNGYRPAIFAQRRVMSQPQVYQQAGLFQNPPAQRHYLLEQRAPDPAPSQQAGYVLPQIRSHMDPALLPQEVTYVTKEKPGTIVIDTNNRFLYLVEGNGMARRYGVGVGKPGFEWAGVHRISRKEEWPEWIPPKEMIAREAAKGHMLPAHMAGGEDNPLGARAMYLGSSLYRIHGTNAPWTIGYAVSSGCIRLRNQDIADLYERVKVGTRVIVQ